MANFQNSSITTPAVPAAPITVDDLLKIVMAMKKTEAPADPVNAADLTSLIASIQAMTPKRQVLSSEFKTKSAFNPTGNKSRTLKHKVYQNGMRIQIDTLFDEEIKLLNSLPEGRFIDRLVTVRKIEGVSGNADELRIEYANHTHDQRIQIAQRIRSFVSLLRQVHEEAATTATRK